METTNSLGSSGPSNEFSPVQSNRSQDISYNFWVVVYIYQQLLWDLKIEKSIKLEL